MMDARGGIILFGADLDLVPLPPPDPDRFRSAMGMLPTGSPSLPRTGPTDRPARPRTRSPLSIEPMLMLACLDRGSRTLLAVQAADRFGSASFTRGRRGSPAASPPRPRSPRSGPGSTGPSATGCRRSTTPSSGSLHLRDVIAGGDHVIVTGEVTEAWRHGEGEPLVFHGRRVPPASAEAGQERTAATIGPP